MDVFKLAFETTIVGLLTFVWLGLATYFLFPDSLKTFFDWFKTKVVEDYQTPFGVGALILAYCLGSAILPIADQLVNDEHWPLNENGIRCQVFVKQEDYLRKAPALPKDKDFSGLNPRHCSYWAALFSLQDQAEKDRDKSLQERILTVFQVKESAVLNQVSDKTERLRQLHERIVVLRGAVFSVLVLFLISISAWFARIQGDPAHWIRTICGGTVGALLVIFAIYNGLQDLKQPNIFDIPVLEVVLLVVVIFGIYLLGKGVSTRSFRTKRYILIALFFGGLTYGGWMWSEILYDQQVINTYVVLQKDVETSK